MLQTVVEYLFNINHTPSSDKDRRKSLWGAQKGSRFLVYQSRTNTHTQTASVGGCSTGQWTRALADPCHLLTAWHRHKRCLQHVPETTAQVKDHQGPTLCSED